jgi:hypothetical protein
MLNELFKKFLAITKSLNMYGINLPMIKDPKSGIGSVSLTLVFISSIMVILGLVGKWSGKLGIIDINNALEFFYASSALYFGRNWKTGATVKEDQDPGASPKDGTPPAK